MSLITAGNLFLCRFRLRPEILHSMPRVFRVLRMSEGDHVDVANGSPDATSHAHLFFLGLPVPSVPGRQFRRLTLPSRHHSPPANPLPAMFLSCRAEAAGS
jgi:hypothetical protein